MGLDQYVYLGLNNYKNEIDSFYWRKHVELNKFIMRYYDGDGNGKLINVTNDMLMDLYEAYKSGELYEYSEIYREQDFDFIVRAYFALNVERRQVFYEANW